MISCQVNLDLRQTDARKARGDLPDMPVLYITQLLGLALGRQPKQLGIEALCVSADALLKEIADKTCAATGEIS